ncbi:MAG: CopG family transcriptional regulator [Acidimicrobiales bacterium]
MAQQAGSTEERPQIKRAGKTKLSVTLDAAVVDELRQRVGARGLSAAVNQAVVAEVDRLRRAAALDQWLAELETSDGPVDEARVARFEALLCQPAD